MSVTSRIFTHAVGEVEKSILNLAIAGATLVVLSIVARGVGGISERY